MANTYEWSIKKLNKNLDVDPNLFDNPIGSIKWGYRITNENGIFIELNKKNSTSTYFKPINKDNLIASAIYFAVRHCIEASWLNDRDLFLFPYNNFSFDIEFISDSLVFALFHSQNRVSSKDGINHWIPFTEEEVYARGKFESHFMTDFIKGKIQPEQ
jgi:hypothetical protein